MFSSTSGRSRKAAHKITNGTTKSIMTPIMTGLVNNLNCSNCVNGCNGTDGHYHRSLLRTLEDWL